MSGTADSDSSSLERKQSMRRSLLLFLALLLLVSIQPLLAENIISFEDVSVDEGSGDVAIPVVLDMINMTGERIVLEYTVTMGTAYYDPDIFSQLNDYSPPSVLKCYIPKDVVSANVGPFVSIINDTDYERNETFTITITSAYTETSHTAIPISDNSAQVTILDNDKVDLAITDDPRSESESRGIDLWLPAFLSPRAWYGEQMVVEFTITPGTASYPADYTTTKFNYYFDDQVCDPINLVNDDLLEKNETLHLTITNVYLQNSKTPIPFVPNEGTITITDDDVPPRVINITGPAALEDNTDFYFDAYLDKPNNSAFPVTISFHTINGLASAPGDFQETSMAVTGCIAPNSSSGKFGPVHINEDNLFEINETFTVMIDHAYIVDPADPDNPWTLPLDWNTGAATIFNDDSMAGIALIEDITQTEGMAISGTVDLDMPNNTGERIAVEYTISPGTATSPADFTASTPAISFIDLNSSSALVGPALTVDDNVWEANETILITITKAYLETSLKPVTVNDNTGIITIADNDTPPNVTLQSAAHIEDDFGLNFKVALDKPNNTDERILLQYTVAPNTALTPGDYLPPTAFTGAININASSGTIGPVRLVEDAIFEANETFTVTLTRAWTENTGRDLPIQGNSATGTIENDDPLPLITLQDVARSEGDPPPATNPYTVTVTLSNPAAFPITVYLQTADNSATAGSDYAAWSGTASLTPLATAATASGNVDVWCDNQVETDESFFVNGVSAMMDLGGGVTQALQFADGQGVFTLSNDDKVADVEIQSLTVNNSEAPFAPVSQVIAGKSYAWSIAVANKGEADAEGVVITDPLPANVTFNDARVSGTAAGHWSWDYNKNNHTVSFTAAYLPVDGTVAVLQILCTVQEDVPEGTLITDQASVSAATHPDPELKNNGAEATVTVLQTPVGLCTDINSDRNVGQAPLLVTFDYLRPLVSYQWWLDPDKRSDWDKPRYVYQMPVLPGKAGMHDIRMDGPLSKSDAADFIRVYGPGGYGHLQLIGGSPTTSAGVWENAIDGDVYGYDGSTETCADASGKAWAVFAFSDFRARKINKIRLLTDTGVDNVKRQVTDFEVYVSLDSMTYTRVLTARKSNNTHTPCALFDDWAVWDVEPVEARFIKLVITAPLSWTYAALGEFEVWFDTRLACAENCTISVTGDQVTLTVKDSSSAPISGLTQHDIVMYSCNTEGYYGDAQFRQAAQVTEDASHPGVYQATLADHGTVKASVNGVLVPKPVGAAAEAQSVDQVQLQQLPTEFALRQNYPNPFNPVTALQYQLPEGAEVLLTIYDTNSRVVATLVNAYQPAGYYTANWNAAGHASGIYFYRLKAGKFQAIKRMVLLR